MQIMEPLHNQPEPIIDYNAAEISKSPHADSYILDGKYKILHRLGDGLTSVVYLAEVVEEESKGNNSPDHLVSDPQRVALKIFKRTTRLQDIEQELTVTKLIS